MKFAEEVHRSGRSANPVSKQEERNVNRSLVTFMVILLMLGTTGEALAVSQAGAISLTIPIGARWNALGEAGTAAATGITSMWWNVGGFAFFPDRGERFLFAPQSGIGLSQFGC